GAQANLKLTFRLGHPLGAAQCFRTNPMADWLAHRCRPDRRVGRAPQLYRPRAASHAADVLSPSPSPASLASADVTRHFADAKVRALAASQSIPLRPALKILEPASSVPASMTDYLGAWGGDRRWPRGGRQAMLIIESVANTGVARGVYAHGPLSNPNAVNR